MNVQLSECVLLRDNEKIFRWTYEECQRFLKKNVDGAVWQHLPYKWREIHKHYKRVLSKDEENPHLLALTRDWVNGLYWPLEKYAPYIILDEEYAIKEIEKRENAIYNIWVRQEIDEADFYQAFEESIPPLDVKNTSNWFEFIAPEPLLWDVYKRGRKDWESYFLWNFRWKKINYV